MSMKIRSVSGRSVSGRSAVAKLPPGVGRSLAHYSHIRFIE